MISTNALFMTDKLMEQKYKAVVAFKEDYIEYKFKIGERLMGWLIVHERFDMWLRIKKDGEVVRSYPAIKTYADLTNAINMHKEYN